LSMVWPSPLAEPPDKHINHNATAFTSLELHVSTDVKPKNSQRKKKSLPRSVNKSISVYNDNNESNRYPQVLTDGSWNVSGFRRRSKSSTLPLLPKATINASATANKYPKLKKRHRSKRKLQITKQRPRSESTVLSNNPGSGSEDGEVFPEQPHVKPSAFTDRLDFSLPQKRIPKRYL
jgi:hypothetical protein